MLMRTPIENCLEVKEYLDEMIKHYEHTSNPILAERRKTYKDIKIALFGEDVDDGDTRKENTQAWFC
tara:strand:- start:153 stop:353 length:201 start_codon:yes stop_codon:yes gene_type:complete